TDSIPLTEAAQKISKIKVRSVAGLIAATIENIHTETSVSSLFN
ncbi:MAG: phosphoribosylpyrophosphate synthetase, partial [Acidobacteriaceae bacterium]|nr:phosphoribosylpyrophosphate synthetase [Acidobacteriaceae bacterium]